ncbi:hypothetical protein METHB2_90003 [Candidatus Methylobacter favarea]|uniref:Uncharacterized protein n=1 Tax=Candidatus Methylobacter favarea TaxID=2707345 RepID=A0A8S0XA07_9GAMM|nr:hypothetical protein METHB2_90003 [Candidatus Methylobacter favarea]
MIFLIIEQFSDGGTSEFDPFGDKKALHILLTKLKNRLLSIGFSRGL